MSVCMSLLFKDGYTAYNYGYNYKPCNLLLYLYGGAEIPEMLYDVEKVSRPACVLLIIDRDHENTWGCFVHVNGQERENMSESNRHATVLKGSFTFSILSRGRKLALSRGDYTR